MAILLSSVLAGIIGFLWLVSLDKIKRGSGIHSTMSYDDED